MSEIQQKKRPTWVTVVAIIGFVISIYSLFGVAQKIMAPKMINMGEEMFEQLEKQQQQSQINQIEEPYGKHEHFDSQEFHGFAEKMFNVPKWYASWMVVTGIIQLLLSCFFFYACLRLWALKTDAVKFYLRASVFKIFHCMVNIAVAFFAGSSILLFGDIMLSIFALVIYVIMLMIVMNQKHDCFGHSA